jgi:1,4-dihydroxy-2-naphthoate polyprenyltransferase
VNLLGTMRLPFLTLVPACMLLGVATTRLDGHGIHWLDLALAVLGGLAAHVAVNALNEWDDFRSGLDIHTERTPFSGGSGTLPARPELARGALLIGLTSVAVAVAVGLFFILKWGWALAPLGLLGLLTIMLYTRWLTRSPLLCLLAPGLGFGPCMVMGTHFALSGHYSWTAGLASLVPLFLVSNLLLLNQFPDLAADTRAGRRHLIIVHGVQAGIRVFGLFLAACFISILAGALLGPLPLLALLGLLTIPLAIPIFQDVRRHHASAPKLIPVMGKNVMITHVTPLLLALGIFLGSI